MASFINLDQQIGVPAEALQTLDSADLEQQGAVAAAEMLPSSDDSQAATKNHAKILQNLSHHNFGMIAVILLTLMLCTVTAAPSSAPASDSSPVPLPIPSPPPPSLAAQQVADPPISNQLDALRSTIAQLQNVIGKLQQKMGASEGEPSGIDAGQVWPFYQRQLARRQMSWQPMKRMVQWQPMKRMVQWQPVKRNPPSMPTNNNPFATSYYSTDGMISQEKEQVILIVEQQLADVLEAGERLGVSAEEILTHLRARNGLA